MDSSQMTSQLAQIDTVSGISSLNTSLSSLSTQLSAGQNAQAALLIGSTVLAPGSTVAVASGAAPEVGVTLGQSASDVKLQITNSSGQSVGSIDLGPQSAGTIPVTWTPTDSSGNALPDGNYTITATAVDGSQSVTATALVASQVEGVVQQAGGAAGLSLANGSTVALSSVSGIL
jgi:flagellar basal-body rod modification protein FlgD